MYQGGCDAALSTCQVLAIKKEVNLAELDFLLRFPSKAGVASPVDFLQPQGWGGIKVGPRSRPLCRGNASMAPSTAGLGSPAAAGRVCKASLSPAAGETQQIPAPGRGCGMAACRRCGGPHSALRQAVGSAIQPTEHQRQPVPLVPLLCTSHSPRGSEGKWRWAARTGRRGSWQGCVSPVFLTVSVPCVPSSSPMSSGVSK